jgi:hypothetical protein
MKNIKKYGSDCDIDVNNIEKKDLMNLDGCNKVAAKKKIFGTLTRMLGEDISNMRNINNRVLNDLADVIEELLNDDKKISTVDEATMNKLAQLLIHHQSVGDSLDSIASHFIEK